MRFKINNGTVQILDNSNNLLYGNVSNTSVQVRGDYIHLYNANLGYNMQIHYTDCYDENGASLGATADAVGKVLVTTFFFNVLDLLINRVKNLEDDNQVYVYFKYATTETGSVEQPVHSTILQERYKGYDGIVAQCDINGRPIDEPVTDGDGNIITVEILSSGDYVLSATPVDAQFCIVYSFVLSALYNSEIDTNRIVETFSIEVPAPLLLNDFLLGSVSNGWLRKDFETVQNLIFKAFADATKEFTGFTNNSNITVTYDKINKKIRLNGDFKAYFKGVLLSELIDGWESPALSYSTPNQAYFLYYNGVGFVWNTSTWTFDYLQIAYVYYRADGTFIFALREVHGFMEHEVHDELHNTIGTYKVLGGTLTNYVLNSTVATNRRPTNDATTIKDEDLVSSHLARVGANYTHAYLTGADTILSDWNNAEIVKVSGNRPYFNEFNGTTWGQRLVDNNQYMCVWVLSFPSAADSDSQRYNFFYLQGQSQGTLASQQALTPLNVQLGALGNISPEFVFLNKIIIRYTAANWIIVQVNNLSGNRFFQTSAAAGMYLSQVYTDETMNGNGTFADPLSVLAKGVSNNIQYNKNGILAGETNFTYDDINKIIGLRQIGDNATSTATQKSSSILEFETSSWNGSAEVKNKFQIQVAPSLTVPNSYFFNISKNGINLFVIASDNLVYTYTEEVKVTTTAVITLIQTYYQLGGTNNNGLYTRYVNAGLKNVLYLKVVNTSHSATVGTADFIISLCKGGASISDVHIFKSDGSVGIDKLTPKAKLDVNGGIRCANDTDTASADKVGTFRYYADANNSYCDMCMQTGASTYSWVNIKTNTW